MNFLQRLFARWRAAWAAARGTETGAVGPLPPPLVNPRIPTAVLVAEAEARGEADARASMQDNWSFGGPDEPVSEIFDPGYVLSLRRRRDVAIQTVRDREAMIAFRTEHVRRWRDENDGLMADARTMMTGLAVREARRDELALRRDVAADGVRLDPADLQNVTADTTVWEGESRPLRPFWRAVILLGLIAAELPVEYFVYRYLLTGTAQSADLALPLGISTAAFMVIGPYVAGLLLRGRQATGAERRIVPAAAALVVPWLFVVVVLGLLRGGILDVEHAVAPAPHLTPTTVILMFIGLLLLVGAMAFMLGLARRHPFQEAYVRQRDRRDRFETMRRAMAERIDAAYREAGEAGDSPEADIQAIRSSYAAAEEAYFGALVRAVGDPTFTDAVQQRRGLRPVVPPPPPDPAPAGAFVAPEPVT